jgi:hypothetical protein
MLLELVPGIAQVDYSILCPSGVRVTTGVEITLDVVKEDKVRLETGEKVPFCQHHDGFA